MSIQSAKGQAAMEVAIFGAMIIFLIGAIIRFTVSSQYTQNQDFKAMRLALSKSLESSNAGRTERNNASVMYIEDRLVPEFNKYGGLERTPLVAQGSGSMTNLIMYPIDEGDIVGAIPKTDVYINGQYFPLSTAAFRAKILVPPIGVDFEPDPNFSYLDYRGWDYTCLCSTQKVDGVEKEICTGCPLIYQVIPNGGREFCTEEYCRGYLTLFEKFNLNRNSNYCDDPPSCRPKYEKVINDHCKRNSIPAGQSVCWDDVAWQWNAARGIVGDEDSGISQYIKPDQAQYPSYDIDNDRKEEVVYALNRINYDDISKSVGLTPEMVEDVKDQLKKAATNYYARTGLSNIQTLIEDLKKLRAAGVVTDVLVIDYQDGDLDLTHDNSSPGSPRGLQNETAIYTRMRQENGDNVDTGTYFMIKEGKLYNPDNGQVVRSVNKRDQVDLVERRILLSNNTHRFCRRNNTRPTCVDDAPKSGSNCEVAVNPVEVCVDDTGQSEFSGCFSKSNVSKTCMDTKSGMIYVRSIIQNRGGHKWITDVSDKRSPVNIR